MVKKERQTNIELLRIVAILGVIILHYNNPGIGKGLVYATHNSLNYYVLYALESIFSCGVNLFMLISGFFMCEKKNCSLWRPTELIVQVVVFKVAIYFLKIFIHAELFSVRNFVVTLVPSNYFVILYCVVFILSIFINQLVDIFHRETFRSFILIMVLLFSVWPTVVDVLGEIRGEQFFGSSSIGMYGSQWGYSVINFILMYLVGAYIKKGECKLLTWKNSKLIALFVGSVLLIIIWARINDLIGYNTERSAWEYCNPLVILIAVVSFILFSRLSLRVNKVINSLAEGAFTVFLLHNIFLSYLKIEKYVKGNVFFMIFHIMGCAVALYLICWCVHRVYHFVTDPIFRKLSSKYPSFMISIER